MSVCDRVSLNSLPVCERVPNFVGGTACHCGAGGAECGDADREGGGEYCVLTLGGAAAVACMAQLGGCERRSGRLGGAAAQGFLSRGGSNAGNNSNIGSNKYSDNNSHSSSDSNSNNMITQRMNTLVFILFKKRI